MKSERQNVEFAIWRKKVDKSLFEHSGMTIPMWACKMWTLPALFRGITSKNEPDARAHVTFQDQTYSASVTASSPHGRRHPAFRLWFNPTLSYELKQSFLMSYMRSLEGDLGHSRDIESSIPFAEFLDIEFEPKRRVFRFVAYYTMRPAFPHLFKRLLGSPAIKGIDDELSGKEAHRIHKQDWKARSEVAFELGAKNVIYFLLATKTKRFYVGEAQDLVKRLLQAHPSIPDWDYFRYDVLPPSLGPYRVTLERMLIRDFAAVLHNNTGIDSRAIGSHSLANDRVDR
jgi:hypothetical protein